MTFDPQLSDLHILALTVYGMCRNASIEEQIALGCKLRNRVINGSTYRVECAKEDCWQPEIKPGNHAKVMALMQTLLTDTVTDRQYIEAAWVGLGMIHGYCRDVLNGATDGHPVSELPRPEWAKHRTPKLSYAKQSWYLPEGLSV